MSSINTNVPSMIAQRVLRNQNAAMVVSLERLATGLRINRGKDDPAGLIASENLRSEKKAISGAISNAQRAEQVINVAEGGLQEIASLLVELKGLVGQSANEAGLSAEEKDANQLQVDSILQTIDRLANVTTFQGTKLLNGNFDYTTTGVTGALLDDVSINATRLANDATLTVTVAMAVSAQTGGVFLSTGTTYVDPGGGGALTIEITGNEGIQQFTFASGVAQTDIINAINSFKDAMGVSAAISRGAAGGTANSNRVELRSVGYGADSFVNVKELAAPTGLDFIFASAGAPGSSLASLKDAGVDPTLLINGQNATTRGLDGRVSTDGFDVSVTVVGTSLLNTTGGSTIFTITGGGADFNLSPDVNLAGLVSIGIESVATGNLGKGGVGVISSLKSGGDQNVVNGDLTLAQKIVDEAVKQIASLRGRLGAFQKYTIGSTIRSLSIALENTAAAESSIRDTDFAAETAILTRQQILSQAAIQTLAIANAQPQSILALLG
ncbi:MAG: flagellin [Planctomycetes bacterium]|nr:flagellin [Planctomycetota bacterium]